MKENIFVFMLMLFTSVASFAFTMDLMKSITDNLFLVFIAAVAMAFTLTYCCVAITVWRRK